MTNKYIVNGIYETTPGRHIVYLGYFKGFEIDKYDFHPIKGYLYWDITDRYGKDYIFKSTFYKDMGYTHVNI